MIRFQGSKEIIYWGPDLGKSVYVQEVICRREDFLGSSDGKDSACHAGDLGSILGLGRSHGERKGNPLQYSCLENSMDRGAWWATVLGNHRVGHKWTPNTKLLEVKPSTYEFCWDTIQLIMYSILSLSYLTFSCLFYFVSSGTAAFPAPVCWYMYFLNTKYLIISLHSTLWSEEQDMPFVVVFEACIVDQLSYS